MLIRSRNRDRSRGGSVALSSLATGYLNGVTPYHYADYITNRMLYAGADVGTVAGGTGYSFTRASDGYYTNSDGTLTLFGSGALRRGDRGVLIEGARTNLLVRSQEFNTTWSLSLNTTLTAAALQSPSGVVDAYFIAATADGTRGISQTFTGTAAAHTFSVYAKPDSSTWFRVQTNDGSTAVNTWFNLSGAGSVGTSGAGHTASIQAAGNGWYRLIVTRTMAASASCQILLRLANADNVTLAVNGNSTYIWGAQVELGGFVSSYIPTVAAAATRAADVLTYTAGVSYGLSLWAEFERVVDTGAVGAVFQIDAGSNNDAARIEHNSSTPALARGLVVTGGVQQALVSALTITLNQVTKMAQRVQTDSVNFARNTTLGTEDTSSTLPATPTTMRVGQTATGAWPFGYIRRAAVFNSALTNAQLQTTTS